MRLLPFAFLALTVTASLGCRRSMAPLCRQMCTCSPCTQDDFDACVTDAEAAQASAEKSECAAPFDTLVSCLEDNVSCRKTDGLGFGTDKCNRADRAMVLCDGSVSPFGSLCEEAIIKTEACTGVLSTQPKNFAIPCVGVGECVAKCELAQPCEVLDGTAPKKPLLDCVNACQSGTGSGGSFGGGPKHGKP
jgi:hypothetical protein